ncbi:MAG: CRTAC1 family protein [Chitinophagales bacterium]
MKSNNIQYKLFLILMVLAGCFNYTANAQFVERAVEVGINHVYRNPSLIGGGVAIFDVNNDDLLDMFIVGGSQSSALYVNNGFGFDKQLVYLGVEDIDFYSFLTNGVIAGDVNNDGYDDLFIATHDDYRNFLMINQHDNTFDIMPAEISGFIEEEWSAGASFGDINKDGWLDIFVANYIRYPRIYVDPVTGNTIFLHEGYRNLIYINNKDNTFTESSLAYGLSIEGTSLACAMTDFDNDNDVDLYVANDFGAFVESNELYENNYPVLGVTDISDSAGAALALFGMGIAIGDYDNDLNLDYYVTNLGKNELLRNNGDKTFTKTTDYANVGDSTVGDGLAVGWGTGFFDYDNDGWQDLYISNGFIPSADELDNPLLNPNALYHNNKDGTFTDVRNAMGIAENGYCRGSAYGDIDNDGDLDLIFIPVNKVAGPPLEGMRAEVEVFYNETINNNHWLKLKLQGVESNRNGYGSHVLLHDSEGNTQLREVDGGSSHGSSNSAIVHFGLGTAYIDSVEIFWINGIYQVLRDLNVNQQYLVIEDSIASAPIDTSILALNNALVDALKIHVFPNPCKNRVTINSKMSISQMSDLSFQLITLDGKILQQSEVVSFPFTIDVQQIPTQQLLLNVYSGKELLLSKEISKL